MRFINYLNEKEASSGNKIELKKETENLGGPKTSKTKMVPAGNYEVVELWEKGILIKKGNSRYFISRNSEYEIKE